ncbi:MAG: energy-coupling factor ABC transporter ATP-binding protein, partial [Helicobacteraceae bacterium]|nr:energy-coupling factor ABC transporter ATP-binding protein [Helicobacteraceae bacterium]
MSCCLSLENLLLKRGDRILCKDINIALEHKDKIAILGHNGSGKTTLLETIAGLIKIESGTIEIFHKKLLTEADFKDIRSKIGYLLQDSDDHFLSPIALDDIAFTLLSRGVKPAEARSEAEKMMMTLGIEPLAN